MKIPSIHQNVSQGARGFIMPLTLVTCVIILTIATGISIILAKELYFSKISRLSQVAYYAADNGLMCATTLDDQYTDPDTGAGIFPYNNLVTPQQVLDKVNMTRQSNGYSALTLNDIKCATSDIFNTAITGYSTVADSRIDTDGNLDSGMRTKFNMRMDLGDGKFRCAKIEIFKTPSYRQIISRGFATCDPLAGVYPVERAIVSTAESADISLAKNASFTILTSSTTWQVPQGITSINVWAVGAGGGGAGGASSAVSAGGGGGGGGVAFNTFSVTPGQIISYSLGTRGVGGMNQGNGVDGGNTSITVSGFTMSATGGRGGRYMTSGGTATGGTGINGIVNASGGNGRNVSSNEGGGAGGAIGGGVGSYGGGCDGDSGGQSIDVGGMSAILTAGGYDMTYPGAGGRCASQEPGGSATGFGSGGGGAASNGGTGGNGRYGGGGGGGTSGGGSQRGGDGGGGVIILSW